MDQVNHTVNTSAEKTLTNSQNWKVRLTLRCSRAGIRGRRRGRPACSVTCAAKVVSTMLPQQTASRGSVFS